MSNIITSVERALDLLLYISHEDGPVGVSQISKAMSMHKSTVFRTLTTLESKRFLEQDPTSGKYTLGVALFSVSRKIKLYDVLKPYTRLLAEKFKETLNIAVLENATDGTYHSTIIAKEYFKKNVLTVNPAIGSSMECYCSAVGKCLLTFSRDISLKKYEKFSFTRHTEKTIANKSELLRELTHVRATGYAVDDEEQEIGLTCVAVPILDSEGWAVAAMSFSGPSVRIHNHGIEVLARDLRDVATEIKTVL